jgi:hypothetical protein
MRVRISFIIFFFTAIVGYLTRVEGVAGHLVHIDVEVRHYETKFAGYARGMKFCS